MKKRLSALLLGVTLLMQIFAGAARAEYALELPGWGGINQNNVVEFEDYYIYVDTKEKHSGNASLHVSYSKPYAANTSVMINLGGNAVSSAKEYKLSFWCKAEGMGGDLPYFLWDWTPTGNMTGINSEWQYFETVFTPSTDSFIFRLVFVAPVEHFWIDDISLTEVGGDGTEIIRNGGLEECPIEPVGEVENEKAQVRNEALKLTWENPVDKNFYGVNIYKLDEEQNETLVFSDETGIATDATVEGLTNGELTTLVIRTVTKYGAESEGKLVFGIPSPSAVSADGAEVTRNGAACSAKVKVYNNFAEDGKEVTAVMVAYDGERMTGFASMSDILNTGEVKEYAFDIPNAGENAVVSIYLFDDLDNAMPLTDVVYNG